MIRHRFMAFGAQSAASVQSLVPKHLPMVVLANHVGWWDPIVAMLLRKYYFPDRVFYAPIDAAALKSYRIFSKMGFFGIEMDRLQGAANFLKTSREILASPRSSLWVTPEGKFTDCRDHARPLMPGLAHLAASVRDVHFVPLAMEYPFWEEVKPMILIRLGTPIIFDESTSKRECGERLETGLRTTQRELAAAVIDRRADAFEYLIAPRATHNSWYDTARAWTAWYHGRPFDPRHGAITRDRQP